MYALLPIVKNTILGLRERRPRRCRGRARYGHDGLAEVDDRRAAAGGADHSGRRARGHGRLGGHGHDRRAHRRRNLGSYIYRGISLSDPRQILLGAIPAALLALACDAALGEVERALDPKRTEHSPIKSVLATSAIAALLALALVGFWTEHVGSRGRPTIVIGSKDGAELILLGHMLADLVEARTKLESIAASIWAARWSASRP